MVVGQFFKNGTAILFKRQTTIISAATIMMMLVLASRVLGLVRDRLLAHFFPVGFLDSYRLAFVLPDFIANVLIVGTLSIAFIPVFTTYLNSKDEKEGWKVASSVLNLSLLFFALVAIVIFIFANVIYQATPLKADPDKLILTANLTRIILVGELLLILGNFFTSVLQSFHRFIIPAIAPVLYNLGIIIGILWFRQFFGFELGLYGVALGVVFGGVFHVLVQVVLAKSLGFKYNFKFRFRDPGVARIVKLSLPRAASIAFAQAEWGVSLFLALFLAAGSAGILGFALDIQNFPIGIFGITFATAAFPTLSMEWSSGKIEDFKTTFLSTFHQILYLTIPISVLFMVLRVPVIRIILGTGFFDWPSTVATAVTMSYFAIGIFAQSTFFLLIRAFYSLHDAATPLKVAFVSLLFHIAISVGAIIIFGGNPIPVSFLGLAFAMTGIFSFVTLLFLLDRKVGGFDKAKLYLPIAKVVFSALLMGVLLYLPLHLRIGDKYIIDQIIDTTRAFNLLVLTGAAFAFGLGIYTLLTWWLQSEELKTFAKLLPDFKKVQKFLVFEESLESDAPSR
ncbi:MAG: murein biosynthesis integral membrane protein MurJ [Candidatus Woykebacteria bacterium RBG_13_40_15]|uniref:Probable lipid II flippase MurJ n=1 Tax=Candidatus Woykebacteria bacterium RBG_13_40_15 TaxID=1802593 RepID=A0A1G1W9B0_9BACT|nr:MAG: murein biosynthesis integral membrane protein MurJ [Candidatus Woykebacteria bacterium RBG_13_40_15]